MNRYRSIETYRSDTGQRLKTNPIYPNIPESADDIYIISTSGDRYDILAKEYYGDQTLWWVIASANNSQKASLALEPGAQIRIPADKSLVLKLYEQVNQAR